jgi:histidyl-tRNA synthetase
LYQAPRGTRDILPEDRPYWNYIEQKVDEISRLYGFRRIETPTFEDTALIMRGVGAETDVVQKEMYTFDDRGGNSLTLRPEGTAPVCRAYLENGMQNLPQPVKLYYLASIFRYERPQAGRFREHHQFGCEAIGEIDPALDAEVIDMAWRLCLSLGISDLSLVINSIGCKNCRPAYLAKLKEYYGGHTDKLCPDCKNRLERNPLRLLDCKKEACIQLALSAPKSVEYLCPDCSNHFEQLKKYLSLLDLPFEVNNCLVRGLDYYTKTVFEIQPPVEGAQSTLAGGGRYDGLIEELGGKPTPGIGFGLGIERLIVNLRRRDISVPVLPTSQVYIASMGDIARDQSGKIAAELRKNNISAIQGLGAKSLKAQLKQANTLGARYAVIIGEDELKAGTATVRDMTTSEQKTVPLSELSRYLKP